MKFWLCCMTNKGTQYKTFQIANLEKLSESEKIEKIILVYSHNVKRLWEHLNFCRENWIESFRVSSDLYPKLFRLFEKKIIDEAFMEKFNSELKKLWKEFSNLILSMHPSQFVALWSPKENVIKNSVDILKEHFYVADLLWISEINIHIWPWNYWDKKSTKERFIKNFSEKISEKYKKFITIENDERNFNIEDTLEVCEKLWLRCTFDIHHHRVAQTKEKISWDEKFWFEKAKKTWKNFWYQRVHLSSPKNWRYWEKNIQLEWHSDFIEIEDFPEFFRGKNLCVDIEAKAKEDAIFQLKGQVV